MAPKSLRKCYEFVGCSNPGRERIPCTQQSAPNPLQNDSKITLTRVRHANGRSPLPRVGVCPSALWRAILISAKITLENIRPATRATSSLLNGVTMYAIDLLKSAVEGLAEPDTLSD